MFPVWCNTQRNIGNDQKPISSSCIATEPHNFKILLFLLYSYHHFKTQRYCYPCITFSLQNFKLLPICQLEFLGLVTPLCFFFIFLRNCVSIIVNIISNNTVLPCYLLWIFVSVRRLLQLIVWIGVSIPPHVKNMTLSFAKSPLKSANYPSPFFLGNSHHHPQKMFLFMHPFPQPTPHP